MSGLDWQWGEHGNRKAIRPDLGGSNGGDDPSHMGHKHEMQCTMQASLIAPRCTSLFEAKQVYANHY